MSPSEFVVLFEACPTRPHCLVLDGGDRIAVAEPRRTLVSKITPFFCAFDDVYGPFGKVTSVGIPIISRVKPVDRSQSPVRTRRRRCA